MDFFFRPKGVAVVGASPSRGKGGNVIVRNLINGYPGDIYPVNPRYENIEGLRCYPSVLDVPDPVELAIVFVAAPMVPGIVRDCARRKIPGAMLESAGFSETGPQGKALQAELLQVAAETGIRLWGPNCLGMVDMKNRVVFSTVTPDIWENGMVSGDVSLVVQSGMLAGAFLIDVASNGIMGFGKACSIGNKIDVAECDLLEYLVEDPDTAAIGLYLESIVDGRRFLSLCRRSTKPIVVLKGGKSAGGAAAAVSHTASMAGNARVTTDLLARAGVVEARDFHQMLDLCRLLARYPDLPPDMGRRVAVLTYSGGAGIVSTDFLEGAGLQPARLSDDTLNALKSVFPEWMPPANPVDLWPGILLHGTQRAFAESLRAVCADPGVDAVLLHCFEGGFDLEIDLAEMAAVARDAGKPLVGWLSGEREKVLAFQTAARRLGVPVYREVYRSVECVAALLHRPRPVAVPSGESLPTAADRALTTAGQKLITGRKGALDEHLSKKILAAAGMSTVAERVAVSADQAAEISAAYGFPVVMKGLCPGLVHKSESGLVKLGIAGPQQVAAGFRELAAAMAGRGQVLIQKQLPVDLELIVGLAQDPQFGTIVMCGMGGVLADVIDDTVFGTAPLCAAGALAMIDRLKSRRLLDGYRGADPVDRGALAAILVQIGRIGHLLPAIREIDINPLVVTRGRLVAVDATVVLRG